METLFGGIYKGKKVLITGHTGFKGSWLALWLSKMGAEVMGYSLSLPSDPNHYELLGLNVTSVTGSILDKQKLQETITSFQPDIVFHMAAQALVRDSYTTPVETFETNVMGTVNVLESCRKAGSVKAIVNITSDKCYQNNEHLRGYVEEDAMGGYDPYSASKGCAELVANSYRNSFFNTNQYGKNHSTLLADVRAGNVIGGGDWAKDRLIPDIMKATAKKETVIIRSPKAVRPWQHVLEPLSGYLHVGWKLLEGKPEFAENWNFGPNDDSSLTVNEVISQTKPHWEDISYDIQESPHNVHEAGLLTLNSSKARTKLKWSSVWDSHKTFEKTVGWYKEYYGSNTVQSEKDLADYVNDAQKLSVEWATL
ncbi:MAG: CDP-glucose 4,6-dehydratase [Patescibacteria group bacterium]|jgi:CDP-glucose 4,6-dehydratase|nr:CDP-glucose 4,6-dehydratase [Patescibacteria group bacterium]